MRFLEGGRKIVLILNDGGPSSYSCKEYPEHHDHAKHFICISIATTALQASMGRFFGVAKQRSSSCYSSANKNADDEGTLLPFRGRARGERGIDASLPPRSRAICFNIMQLYITRARAHHTINALRTLVRCREGYNPTRCNAGCNTSISRRGKCANSRVAIPA